MPQGPRSEGKLRHGALQLPSSLACVDGGNSGPQDPFSAAPSSPCSMSDSAYNTARLWTIVGLCLLRLAVTRHHLQAYLGLAERWVEQMRREAGRIAAVEIQRKVLAL